MPYSSTAFKEEIKRHILANLPLHTKILDVGPGAGTYGSMLRDYYQIDGLEIHEPYIDKFNLVAKSTGTTEAFGTSIDVENIDKMVLVSDPNVPATIIQGKR